MPIIPCNLPLVFTPRGSLRTKRACCTFTVDTAVVWDVRIAVRFATSAGNGTRLQHPDLRASWLQNIPAPNALRRGGLQLRRTERNVEEDSESVCEACVWICPSQTHISCGRSHGRGRMRTGNIAPCRYPSKLTQHPITCSSLLSYRGSAQRAFWARTPPFL